jgi:hypothetical protein
MQLPFLGFRVFYKEALTKVQQFGNFQKNAVIRDSLHGKSAKTLRQTTTAADHKLLWQYCTTLCIVFPLIASYGCQSQSTASCPEKPALTLKNVNDIKLSSSKTTHSGRVSGNQSVGYTFFAKKKQKLDHQIDNKNICIWIYTPDSKILTSNILPQTGKYIVQMENSQGAGSFEIAMSLSNPSESNSSKPAPSQSESSVTADSKAPVLSPSNIEATSRLKPSPSPTKSHISSKKVKIGSPESVVHRFYQEINSRNYESAWAILPVNVRENSKFHPKGYQSFTEFYGGLNGVQVDGVVPISLTESRAEVSLRAQCKLKNGTSAPLFLRFALAWNSSSNQWVVEKINSDPNRLSTCGN